MRVVLCPQPGEAPFVDRIEVSIYEKLHLYENPHVRDLPAATKFERWVFSHNVWSLVPWDIDPLELEAQDDMVFVRVEGVCCEGFGQRLHDYQVRSGLALCAAQRLQSALYEPPPRHRWIILWMEVSNIMFLPLNYCRSLRTSAPGQHATRTLPLRLRAARRRGGSRKRAHALAG